MLRKTPQGIVFPSRTRCAQAALGTQGPLSGPHGHRRQAHSTADRVKVSIDTTAPKAAERNGKGNAVGNPAPLSIPSSHSLGWFATQLGVS
eukprot:362139-Chlamydomonas_euryale.AAC.3